jgi:hypothetical protein
MAIRQVVFASVVECMIDVLVIWIGTAQWAVHEFNFTQEKKNVL